jgi:hypothetical protein
MNRKLAAIFSADVQGYSRLMGDDEEATVQTLGFATYQELLDTFLSLIREKLSDNVLCVVLYGSVARGTARSDSDIDLLVVLNKASPIYYQRLEPFLEIIRQLRRMSCWEKLKDKNLTPYLSLLVLSKEEAERNRYLYLDMIEDAHVLIDPHGFFQSKLKEMQERIQELGARKVKHNEDWYWDLKPDLQPGEGVTL